MELTESIKICVRNGDRLLEDAKWLCDFDRYASAYGIAKLAQEEYAKGFILQLVESGALNWDDEVKRSLNHHVSKQLISIILDHINPDFDEFMKLVKNKTLLNRPPKVSDAINIYIHEILSRWKSSTWWWAEEPIYDKEAKSVFNKKEEKIKHNAFFVKILNDGRAVDSTSRFTKDIVQAEIEKTGRYSGSINVDDFKYKEIVEILKEMKK